MTLDARPTPTRIGPAIFGWGDRTFVMGILNVTPDSFSGDGLLATRDPIATAVDQAIRMVREGADILDIGGESTRPGHVPISATEERDRVVPVIAALRAEGIPLLEEKFRTNLARMFPPRQQARILQASLDQGALEAMPVHEYVDLYVI